MIYKFKSKAAGDVIMMAVNAEPVLRLIGKEPAAQGIIEPAALPAAIAALEQAVAAEDAARQSGVKDDADDTAAPGQISLRQRAWPLVEMMKRSQAANQAIVWGV